jgi:DNA topoisomerase VI subunit B
MGRSSAAVLNRATLKVSRQMDFFSLPGLTAEVGHGVRDWPLVALKEPLENSLDACEECGRSPQIAVTIGERFIEVADNGPGIDPGTVADLLDFDARVSSREAYVSPSRGAQGNALKTLFAMPLVLDGREGRVDIASRGVGHRVTVRLDLVRQRPVVRRTTEADASASIGTRVRLYWPDSPRSKSTDCRGRFLQILDDYAVLNPHLRLTAAGLVSYESAAAPDPTFVKWTPQSPTCPRWYTLGQFMRLVAAYTALAEDTPLDAAAKDGRVVVRLVRELVREFRGFAGSRAQADVLAATGLSRAPLSALLTPDGDLDAGRVGALLSEMQARARPVAPTLLGCLGREHLRGRFEALGCHPESFRYQSRRSDPARDKVPWLFEAAFGYRPKAAGRRLITGINFAPAIVNPFRTLGAAGSGLDAVLQDLRAGPDQPVVILLHLTTPRPAFTDRGKSAVSLGGGAST